MAKSEGVVTLDTLKDVLGRVEATYGTTKEAIAQFLQDLKSGTIADKELARSIKGLTNKLGVLGDLIGIVLGAAIDGPKGAVAAAVGALAGAVAGGIVIGLFGLVAVPGVAVAGVLVGGYVAWKVGDIIEEKVLDALKELDQKPPGSNLPDVPNKNSGNPTSPDHNSHGHEPGDGNSGNPNSPSDPDHPGPHGQDDHHDGGVHSPNSPDTHNGSGWGGDPYSNPASDANGGYNGDGFGGDPYTGPEPITGNEGSDLNNGPMNDHLGHDFDGTEAISPIILDLDGDGIDIIPLNKSSTYYDYNGDGIVGHTAWIGKGDGLLVFDADDSGTVNSAREFVYTLWTRLAGRDMSAVRAVFDTNKDGVLSAADASFEKFKVWVDADMDGVSDPGELKTLKSLGLSAIPLIHNGAGKKYSDGSRIYGGRFAKARRQQFAPFSLRGE